MEKKIILRIICEFDTFSAINKGAVGLIRRYVTSLPSPVGGKGRRNTPYLVVPCSAVRIYKNADTQKAKIITENSKKSGIYLWRNKLNGKTYIGSSSNLANRFTQYFCYTRISKVTQGRSHIHRSLIKNGYSSFELQILEYCDSDKLLQREQYYMDLLKPTYNILKVAGSSRGRKHSQETIAKMKNRIWTEEQKSKRLEGLKRLNSSPKLKAKRLEHLKRLNSSPAHQEQLKRQAENNKGRARPKGAGKPSIPIEVFDLETGIKTIYSSIKEVALFIGCSSGTISNYFIHNQKKPFRGRFVMQKLTQL